jgi:hypothetical protein
VLLILILILGRPAQSGRALGVTSRALYRCSHNGSDTPSELSPCFLVAMLQGTGQGPSRSEEGVFQCDPLGISFHFGHILTPDAWLPFALRYLCDRCRGVSDAEEGIRGKALEKGTLLT